MTRSVNPNVPQISLTMGSITRAYQPIRRTLDGVVVDAYPSQTTLQVDLFTRGRRNDDEPGVRPSWDNTAVDDMTDFVNFINSPHTDNWSEMHDISLLTNNVHDLTGVTNDTTWEYRAMVELTVSFTQTAVGNTGTMWEDGEMYGENGRPLDVQPDFAVTASGGRTLELASGETGWFDRVDGPEFIRKE
jgi:hypothetical protein